MTLVLGCAARCCWWAHEDPALRHAAVSDGRIYIAIENGNVAILQASRVKNVLATVNMGSPVYSTPVPAHNTLFVVTRNQLFALAAKK